MSDRAEGQGSGQERDIPLAGGPDTLAPPHPARESKATRAVVALLGAALLFGPWAAFAAGSRSDSVPGENRQLAPRPEIDGFKTFDELTSYAADHFPLRDAAIRANEKLIGGVFDEPPSYYGSASHQQVLAGEDGWLYFYDDFNKACAPEIPLERVIAGVRRLDAMLKASGRRLVITVPPDKSTADPEHLPKSFEQRACAEAARTARYRALASLGVDGFIDMRAKVRQLEKQKGQQVFLPYDTHWNQDAEAMFTTAVADKLDPALLKGTAITAGQFYKEPGDLETIEGIRGKLHPFQAVYVVRDGVTVTPAKPEELRPEKPGLYTISRFTATSTSAPLFQPRTVWIGDSFTQRAMTGNKFQPFFRDVTRVPELTKGILAGVQPQAKKRMIQEIVASKVVVIELVERTMFGVGGYGSMWDTVPQNRFLDDLQAALDKAPKQ